VRRQFDPDPAVSLTVEDAVYGGAAVSPAWKAARRRMFEPSDLEPVEHQRRITLAAFALAVIGTFGWLVLAGPMDKIVSRVAAVTPLAVGLPLFAVVIAVVWARELTHAIVGPGRNLRLSIAAVLGIVAAGVLFVASPTIIGA
jgi:hypothetical protein